MSLYDFLKGAYDFLKGADDTEPPESVLAAAVEFCTSKQIVSPDGLKHVDIQASYKGDDVMVKSLLICAAQKAALAGSAKRS